MAKVFWFSPLRDYQYFEYKWYGDLRAYSHSSKNVTMIAPNGVKYSVSGHDLKVNPYGQAIGGTVTSIVFYTRDGAKLQEFSELKEHAHLLHSAIMDNGWEEMRGLVLYGDDILIGSSISDVLYGYEGDDVFHGKDGDDRIYGWYGNDRMYGDAGDDWLQAADGDDKMYGGSGSDLLVGSLGRDMNTGGAGPDLFLFRAPKESTLASSGRDIILDFSRSQRDKIQLDVMDADTKKAGDQDFTFIGTKAFTAAAQIRYEKKGGDTFVYGNVDSDKTAEFAIVIDASIDLKASDFIL